MSFPSAPSKSLALIKRDLARFQRALEDLLDLGRLEAGTAALVLADLDARDLSCTRRTPSGPRGTGPVSPRWRYDRSAWTSQRCTAP